MNKTIKSALCLLAILLLFTGCKIQNVEDAVNNAASSALAETETNDITQSSESQPQNVEQNGTVTAIASPSKSPDVTTAPNPIEPEHQTTNKASVKYCYLTIECKTILNNMNKFNKDKLSILPSDGIILSQRKVIFYDGETVFDVLNRETKKNRIHMEFEATPVYNSNYIEGIGNIYEFDCGELSGWMYSVNGVFPNYGVSRYKLNDGDKVEFKYTCDLGRDLGHEWDGIYHDE